MMEVKRVCVRACVCVCVCVRVSDHNRLFTDHCFNVGKDDVTAITLGTTTQVAANRI